MTQYTHNTATGKLITELLLDGTIWTRRRALQAMAERGIPLSVAGLDYYISVLMNTGELVKLPDLDPADKKSVQWQARGDIGPLDRYIRSKILRQEARA